MDILDPRNAPDISTKPSCGIDGRKTCVNARKIKTAMEYKIRVRIREGTTKSCKNECNGECKKTPDERGKAGRLALAQETALREGLLEVIPPSRKIGIEVSLQVSMRRVSWLAWKNTETEQHALVDVRFSRKVLGITTDVDVVRRLVHSDIVHFHGCRECQMFQIHRSEVGTHTQVRYDILGM